MNKAFKLRNLDCADCAAKLERKLAAIDGVNEIRVNFIFQKMLLDYDENRKQEVFAEIKRVVAEFDDGIVVVGL